MTMRFPPRIVEKRMQGKACEKREGWERKMEKRRQALLESKPWKNTGSLLSVWRGLWKSEKKRKEKKSERTKRQGTKNSEKWNERKKRSVQTDMEKGIKGRSACQSRHNLGRCKKTAIWLTIRQNTPEKSKKRKRSEWRKSVDDKTKERKQ